MAKGSRLFFIAKLLKVCAMQKADIVLTMLNQKSKNDSTYKFGRLYRNLFNLDFYLNAYAKIYSKEGNMTEGVDGKTIDGFGISKVNKLIEQMKLERYNPQPVRRKYIQKKSGKLRPLGIPTTEDKLVQEVIRQILEAIYEPQFSHDSHGFRPNRSCHTALCQMKNTCNGSAWIIEGDIKGFFDNINHEILIELLKRKIDDGRFINLIMKFLKAGIMEEGNIRNSITGTPQGGIISPLLANIYLDELDKYMEQVKSENEIGKYRKVLKEYNRLSSTRTRRRREGKYLEADNVLNQMYKMQAKDPMDSSYRRVKYIRYADDFVVLIHGSKTIAEKIREEIALFLRSKLKLELNIDKTLITNLQKDKARFLGYEIIKAQSYTKMTVNTNGRRQRSVHGQMQLLVPREVIREKIKKFTKNGKPTYINERVTLPIQEMIAVYNTEIRGLVNYYSIANNVSKRLYEFKFYHYFSLAKTLAKKHKMSVKKIIRKFRTPVKRKDGTGTVNIIGVKYHNKTGEQIMTYFNKSIKRKYNPVKEEIQPEIIKTNYKNELIRRLLYGKCELCKENQTIEQFEVHHIRNLKKLKDKFKDRKIEPPKWLKIMIHIRRKTLVVCKDCHKTIHKRKI
jgi:group II intron reverse transcriptase/maturase